MNKRILIFSATLFLMASCGGETKKTVETEDSKPTAEEMVVDYNIPSPSDQFSLISKLDVGKNTKIMHNPEDADKYSNSAQKALNFGVYTADVAYLTSFNETNQYLTYFGKLEKLGKDIGVAQVFGTELGELAKKWDGNADSLFRLSDETYNKTFKRLIEIDKGTELSLMLVGGWIESMHLMIGSSKGYGKSPKLEQAIAEQKVVAENLVEFLVSYQDDKDVAAYTKDLRDIIKIYDKLECSSGETKVGNSNGKLTFTGGDECKMTEACFTELKSKIAQVRTKITSIK